SPAGAASEEQEESRGSWPRDVARGPPLEKRGRRKATRRSPGFRVGESIESSPILATDSGVESVSPRLRDGVSRGRSTPPPRGRVRDESRDRPREPPR